MADSQDRSPVELLCDLLVYAPLGFAVDAPRLVPELATRGREQVATARSVGQLVVRQAGTRLAPLMEAMVGGLLSGLGLSSSPPPDTTSTAGTARLAEIEPVEAPPAAVEREEDHPLEASRAGVPPADSLAIPHYDSLAASQVVPRLTALSVEELGAVRAYESGQRGRRTILNRIDQLLDRARGRAS